MTTVLIEEYAILRAALQHTLETEGNIQHVMAMAPGELKEEMPSPPHPVELLVLGATGQLGTDLRILSMCLSVLAPTHVLVLYETLDPRFLRESARVGVAGMLPKSSLPQAIAAAVKLVLAGGECFPCVIPQLDGDGTPPSPPAPRGIRALTTRQTEILRLLAKGHTMREVSQLIGISVATVKSHARALYWKLNARNQAEATFIAMQEGLLQDDDHDLH